MGNTVKLSSNKLIFLLICALSLSTQLAHSKQGPSLDKNDPLEVRHLAYVYHTQPHFDALVEINAAREANPNLNKSTALTLMLAELYLKLDYLDQAQALLFSLSHHNDAYKNELLIKLAAKYYARKNFTASARTLDKVTKALSHTLREQYKLQKGMTFLAMGNFREASKVLDDIANNSLVGAYAQYNLGIALLNLRKFDRGIRALNKLGHTNFKEEELKNLKDRSNISLGFLHMRAQEPVLAKRYLERVRLSSKFSNQALLGMGLADILNKQYKEALIPLLELHDRPVFDNATIEAYLAVPHALSNLNSNKHALDFYEQAIALFEQQLATTIDLATQIKASTQPINELLSFEYNAPKTPSNLLLARLIGALIDNSIYTSTANHYSKLSELKKDIPTWKETYQNHTASTEKTSLDRRLDVLDKQIDASLSLNETLLTKIVLNELNQESDKLNQYLNQARFSMAQIYDKILNQRIAP